MGEHGQGDVAVPPGVLADLVLVESGLALGGLEGLLNGPPGPGDPGQLGQAHLGWGEAEVVGELGGVVDRAAGQQPIALERVPSWWRHGHMRFSRGTGAPRSAAPWKR